MQVRTVTSRATDTSPKSIIVTRADGDTLPLGGPRYVGDFLPEFGATVNHASAAEHFAWESLGMTAPTATGRHLGYGSYLWDVVDLANTPEPTNPELWKD